MLEWQRIDSDLFNRAHKDVAFWRTGIVFETGLRHFGLGYYTRKAILKCDSNKCYLAYCTEEEYDLYFRELESEPAPPPTPLEEIDVKDVAAVDEWF